MELFPLLSALLRNSATLLEPKVWIASYYSPVTGRGNVFWQLKAKRAKAERDDRFSKGNPQTIDLFSHHSLMCSKMLLSAYSVPGIQATKVNKKHSLPSKTLQSNGKVSHDNSHFQFCMISVLMGTNIGYYRNTRERRQYCKELRREENKAPLWKYKYFSKTGR